MLLNLFHDLLEALLEIAAITRSGEQRAHVEREDRRVGEHVGNLALGDLAREAFRDRRLADARIADEQRVVLLAPAQHLDRAHDLRLAADQGVDAVVARLAVQVDAIGVERAFLLALVAVASLAPFAALGFVLDSPRRARRVREAGAFGDAVADVVDRVIAGHFLLLQEVDGVALALREKRDENIGAVHILAAGGLHADDGALHDAVEARGGLRLLRIAIDQIVELPRDIFAQIPAEELEVDRAGAQHRGGVGILDQAQQQMLERRIFMTPLSGQRQSPIQGLLEIARDGRHASWPPISFP